MIWSYPANFISGARWPPALESPRIPVWGDFADTLNLQAVGNMVPTRGPVANINLFSGPSGSVPGPTSSWRVLELKPLPPRNCMAFSRSSSLTLDFPFERSILRIFPA
jgi:hypothetical protein